MKGARQVLKMLVSTACLRHVVLSPLMYPTLWGPKHTTKITMVPKASPMALYVAWGR